MLKRWQEFIRENADVIDFNKYRQAKDIMDRVKSEPEDNFDYDNSVAEPIINAIEDFQNSIMSLSDEYPNIHEQDKELILYFWDQVKEEITTYLRSL